MAVDDFEVEKARPEQAEAVADFFNEPWEEYGPTAPGFAGAAAESIHGMADPASLREWMGRKGQRIVLARTRNAVKGFAAVRAIGEDEAELVGIVVLRGLRTQDLGSRLLDAAVRAARLGGSRALRVRTEVTNAGALAFYESRGFDRRRRVTEAVGTMTVECWELSRGL